MKPAPIDAGALLTYRAAWLRDTGQGTPKQRSVAAAMAKMTATENAQRVIDMAQLHGGLGVMVGSKVSQLYRDIRALRIYGRDRGAAAHHRQGLVAGVRP